MDEIDQWLLDRLPVRQVAASSHSFVRLEPVEGLGLICLPCCLVLHVFPDGYDEPTGTCDSCGSFRTVYEPKKVRKP